MSTPCGVNCSYVVEFQGPYFDCNASSPINTHNDFSLGDIPIYNGTWFEPRNAFEIQSTYNGTFTLANFVSSTFTPIAANEDVFHDKPINNGSIILQQNNLICIPGRASYTINNTYVNGAHIRTVIAEPIDPLINLCPLTYHSEVVVPGFNDYSNSPLYLGTGSANWSSYALGYYRDNNIMTIFDALMGQLQGSYIAQLQVPTELNLDAPSNSSEWFGNLVWNAYVETTETGGTFSSAGKLPFRLISTSCADFASTKRDHHRQHTA